MPTRYRSIATLAARAERVAQPARLALFWLGIQAVWGALLGISLQARTHELTGANALASYGTIATLGALVAAVVQIASGALSDASRARIGRAPFYFAGALVAAAGIAWFYLAHDFSRLVAAFVVVQVGMNIAMGPYQAVIPDFVPASGRGMAAAWMAGMQGLGNAIGAVAASFLGNQMLALTLVVLLGITCVATALHVRNLRNASAPLGESVQDDHVSAPQFKGTPPPAPRPPLRGAPQHGARHLVASEALPEERRDTAASQVTTRALVDLFLSRAFVYAGFYTLLGYLFFYVGSILHATRVSTLTGVLLLIFTLFNPLGALLAAKPSDRQDKRIVAAVGGALFVAALLIFIAVPSWPAVIAATLLAGVGWGIFLVADWALGCRMVPPIAAATAMALWNLAVVGPQIVAPSFTTLVLARTGNLSGPLAPRVALLLAACEVFTGIVWLMRLPRGLARE
jgi:MFS family permease